MSQRLGLELRRLLTSGFSDWEGNPRTKREQRRVVNHRSAVLQGAEEVTGDGLLHPRGTC
jgi:hypothetical protein